MKKLNVGIIFGGRSQEHEISLMSATSIIKAIDKEKYDYLPIGITKSGQWMIYNGPIEKIETGEWEEIANKQLMENPDGNLFSVIPMGSMENTEDLINFLGNKVDVVFPVLHGPFGEDGTIQGLFEMANIPYVGSGVLSSSLCMDKVYTKKILQCEGLNVVDYLAIMSHRLEANMKDYISIIEKSFGYPVFIKPANLGSSVGVTKAKDRDDLIRGLEIAAKYDRRILVERAIDGRELECAVLGNEEPEASVVGEIIPANEFYDYEAKYFSGDESKLIIPADLPKEKSEEIRKMAIEAHKALDCSGLSRVDFFLEKGTNKVYINEINTIPGFTKFSMYPLLWQEAGIPYHELIDKLIQFALKRFEEREKRGNK